jgi:hypothetical protein
MVEALPRWDPDAEHALLMRAFPQAQRLGHAYCLVEHVLLALLDPPVPTAAGDVLHQLGVTSAAVEAMIDLDTSRGNGEVVSAVSYHRIMGAAAGIALSESAETITDDHVLVSLAFLYPELLRAAGAAPEQVVQELAARGHRVPSLLPPPPRLAVAWGPVVYYPAEDHAAVVQAMVERYPPGTLDWGFNVSNWRPGQLWMVADADIPLVDVVRGAVGDPTLTAVVDRDEAIDHERACRP